MLNLEFVITKCESVVINEMRVLPLWNLDRANEMRLYKLRLLSLNLKSLIKTFQEHAEMQESLDLFSLLPPQPEKRSGSQTTVIWQKQLRPQGLF